MENNNNIEDKYYIPTIEEIHVGFEFESKEGYKLKIKDINSLHDFIELNDFKINSYKAEYSINTELYRVKYLDKEDIESLGFSPRLERSTARAGHDSENSFIFKKELTFPLFENMPDLKIVYLIYKGPNDRSVLYLTRNRYVGIDDNIMLPEIQLFNGYIKNISELQQLLHQLGIL